MIELESLRNKLADKGYTTTFCSNTRIFTAEKDGVTTTCKCDIQNGTWFALISAEEEW